MVHFQLDGYFTEQTARKIKAAMDGKTFMRFEIGIASLAGNWVVSAHTNYFAEDKFTPMEDKIAQAKGFFFNCLLETLCRFS